MSFLTMARRVTPAVFKRPVHQARRYRDLLITRRRFAPRESSISSALAVARLAIRPEHTILFYPSYPDPKQVVYKLCVLNNYRMTNDPRTPHWLIHKHVDTSLSPTYTPVERARERAINAGSLDIRKQHVQEVFEAVFGYGLAVDPRTHRGRAVRKSDDNCRHDGAIVECPLDPGTEEGVVYQKLVETDNGAGYCLDHRVPIYGGEVPLVYLKYRPTHNRFATFEGAEIVEPGDVFTPEELEQLRQFARAMGLDFGEMDVLRDNEDQRLYVVDVNNTPAGPPPKLQAEELREAAARLAAAYRALIESRAV
jgi:hypothetical protein